MKREENVVFNYKNLKKDNSKKNKIKNLEEVSHHEIKTHSIIDVHLWDKTTWKGFGFAFSPDTSEMWIFLVFENSSLSKKIFDNWKVKVGETDNEELIKIIIVKGVNKEHPNWYKIIVTVNEKIIKISSSNNIIQIPSRIHKMTPNTSKNLDNLVLNFNLLKKYKLIPAFLDSNGSLTPYYEKSILKTSLIIKDAWEIGKNDLARVAIQSDDNPIIPEGVKNAPVLEILNNNKN